MNTYRQTSANAAARRKIAITAGMLFLITHVTSVGAFFLYDPVLNHADYVLGAGSESQVLLGALFEVILALTVIGTAVALYPIVKQQNEGVALGYVGLRTLEAGIIAVGVLPLLALVSLRASAGVTTADPEGFLAAGSVLVAWYEWTTLLGPGLVCGTNTVLMAYLMYRSRLVPRIIPILGLVGGPLIFVVTVVKMFGILEQLPEWTGITVIPIFAWEVTLALWLIFKGFRSFTSAVQPAPAANDLFPQHI